YEPILASRSAEPQYLHTIFRTIVEPSAAKYFPATGSTETGDVEGRSEVRPFAPDLDSRHRRSVASRKRAIRIRSASLKSLGAVAIAFTLRVRSEVDLRYSATTFSMAPGTASALSALGAWFGLDRSILPASDMAA